jgi:hypothetical protein
MQKYKKFIPCSRCKGTGMTPFHVVYAGVPGTCFKCGGEGQVERKAYHEYNEAKKFLQYAPENVALWDKEFELHNTVIERGLARGRDHENLEYRWQQIETIEKHIDTMRLYWRKYTKLIQEIEAKYQFV